MARPHLRALAAAAALLLSPLAALYAAPVAAQEEEPLIQEPALLELVQAPYPAEAEAAGLEGRVLLLIEIDEAGVPTSVAVLEPAGHGFDEAAVAAAQAFRFVPAATASGPVPVAIEFGYEFRLAPPEPVADPAVEGGAPAAEALPVTLEGELVEMGTRRPLADLPVQVVAADGTRFDVMSDGVGHFAVPGAPVGAARLRVIAPGYDEAETTVEITAGEVTSVKLWVRNLAYRDNEIVAVYQKKREPEITRRTLSAAEIRRVPGAFGDPVRVIQNLPGAARGPFGLGLLVIRGANPEDSNVYVDGVEVPIIYHLGGYRSVVNAELIDSVDYLPGGYGVKYGRSTGGVIDVQSSRTYDDQAKFTWKTDVLDTGLFFKGKVGEEQRWGVQLGARRSYIDAFIPFFTQGSQFTIKPRWFDYQAKADRLVKGDDQLTVFAFGFQDKLFIQTPDDFAQGSDADTQGDLSTVYQTHRQIVSWTHRFDDQWSLWVQPAVGVDDIQIGLGTSFSLEQRFTNMALRSELRWTPREALGVNLGLDTNLTYYKIGFSLPFLPDFTQLQDPLAEREPFRQTIDGWYVSPDPYLDLRWRPLGDALLINPGVRLNTLKVGEAEALLSVDPRLGARWAIGPTTALKAGSGLYQQPPQGQEFGISEDELNVNFERGWTHELGVEQRVGTSGTIDWTGFYKGLDKLIVQNPDAGNAATDPIYVNEGIGRIYGMEIMLRKALVDRWFGWISYTLSKSERNDYPARSVQRTADGVITRGPDAWYDYDFDQTNILTMIGGYRLPRDFEVSGRFQHVTGNPYTPYALAVQDLDSDSWAPIQTGAKNTARLGAYTALDLRADKLFTFKYWQLEVYLDLLNVIRGENPEQLQYNYDYTESAVIRGLPFIASPGFQADFRF